MGLTVSQRTIFEKAKVLGGGAQGVALDNADCAGLVAIAARDLGVLARFPGVPRDSPEFFEAKPLSRLRLEGHDALQMFEVLVGAVRDADVYFALVAALHKARLKFQRILEAQPMPTTDQVGPRGLLEYGALRTDDLAALLFWRKWMFDIDNRAAQETGYLFQPVVAGAIGGTPAAASSSPVRRLSGGGGRQVDCIREKRAYELKLRVTIAASGQGRWQEELDFPEDCKASGYRPVLIVFDATDNPKLRELVSAFAAAGGESYVGEAAWKHLEDQAGATMSKFLEKYVRRPLEALLQAAPADAPQEMPPLRLEMTRERVTFTIRDRTYDVRRSPAGRENDGTRAVPEEASDPLPGM